MVVPEDTEVPVPDVRRDNPLFFRGEGGSPFKLHGMEFEGELGFDTNFFIPEGEEFRVTSLGDNMDLSNQPQRVDLFFDGREHDGNYVSIGNRERLIVGTEGEGSVRVQPLPGNRLFNMLRWDYAQGAWAPHGADELEMTISGGDSIDVQSRRHEGKIPSMHHDNDGGDVSIDSGRSHFTLNEEFKDVSSVRRDPEFREANSVPMRIESNSLPQGHSLVLTSSDRYSLYDADGNELVSNRHGTRVTEDLDFNMVKTLDDLRHRHPHINFGIIGGYPPRTTAHFIQSIDEGLEMYDDGNINSIWLGQRVDRYGRASAVASRSDMSISFTDRSFDYHDAYLDWEEEGWDMEEVARSAGLTPLELFRHEHGHIKTYALENTEDLAYNVSPGSEGTFIDELHSISEGARGYVIEDIELNRQELVDRFGEDTVNEIQDTLIHHPERTANMIRNLNREERIFLDQLVSRNFPGRTYAFHYGPQLHRDGPFNRPDEFIAVHLEQPSSLIRDSINLDYNDITRRTTQLMYDGGIISNEEYRERMGDYCNNPWAEPCGRCQIYTLACEPEEIPIS